MLIDPELGDVERVDIGQRLDRAVHRLLDGPPGNVEGTTHPSDGSTVTDHRLQYGVPQPARTPCPERQFRRAWGERPARTSLLDTPAAASPQRVQHRPRAGGPSRVEGTMRAPGPIRPRNRGQPSAIVSALTITPRTPDGKSIASGT